VKTFLSRLGLLVSVFLLLGAGPASAAGIEFSPVGLVKEPRQVRARFAQPMVTLGDPRAAASPFTIDCPAPGKGRWADSRTWLFDFDASVGGGLRCSFTTAAELKSLAGESVAPESFSFSTGGPAVVWQQPSWGDIEENQAIALGLDAEAAPESVLAHVHFAADDIVERIPVRIVEGDEREAILATLYPELRAAPIVIVQPRQSLPPGRKVRLVWGAGVATPAGVAGATDQVIEFSTRPELTATFHCGRDVAKADCNPLRPMSLRFTAPVARRLAERTRLRAADGSEIAPSASQFESETVQDVSFRGPFPASATLQLVVAADLADDSGRPLANASTFPLEVRTAAWPPLAKFAARFGILESGADPALPVTVRNIEREIAVLTRRATEDRDPSVSAQLWRAYEGLRGRSHVIPASEIDRVLPWLRRLALTPRDKSVFAVDDIPAGEPPQSFTLPKPLASEETEVLGIPLTVPGLHIVEIESPSLGAALLGKSEPMFVPAAALVTNLGVHFKWGATGSLAWVTRLDDGKPAAGVEVFVLDCSGTPLWTGITDAQGRAEIADLPREANVPDCPLSDWPEWFWTDEFRALRGLTGGLLVVARTQDDFSFAHSSWDDGIEPWRFRVDARSWGDPTPLVTHTVLDRALFRVGETVHMKHLFRRRTEAGLEIPPTGEQPTSGRIVHVGSQQEYPLSLAGDATAVAESTWQIPAGAKLGRYAVEIGDETSRQTAAELRVEEFRIPVMAGTISFADTNSVAPPHVDVDLSLRYLAGGAARDLPIVLRSQVRPREFSARHPWGDLRFANGPVKTGVEKHTSFEDQNAAATEAIRRTETALDASGSHRVRLDGLPPIEQPSELLVEMEYRDPAGEVQTIARTQPLFPADRLVAIERDEWMTTPDRLGATIVVADPQGAAVADAEVVVEVFEKRVFSHRKRLVGGFYSYEHVTDISGPVATLCRGRTASNGAFACSGQTTLSGNLVLQASVVDSAGRTSTANADVWVAGDEHWWFEVEDHDRMDLLPERHELAPGDTARIQVRSPFREATALVTIEREGVLESFVTTLAGNEPVIEVPIRREHAPNVFVSVLAVRGRVADVTPTAMVDLGKPAFRLGLVELRVGWESQRLDVAVRPDKEAYEVRSTALVDIEVRSSDGTPLPAGAEVAVAAVDEGLLELGPNPSWSVLETMMEPRAHWVGTATAQGQVVGKRHFGRKALPTGGGGGLGTARELFDTLLFWEPRVRLDDAGKARVEIPLNDSLTAFRIVAIATAGADRFGTGAATIRITQDLMLVAGLPPVVRQGDRFTAGFTIRNASAAPQSIAIAGAIENIAAALPARQVELAPGAAQTVTWDIDVPRDVTTLRYRVTAASSSARDEIVADQRVVPVHAVQTLQATLVQAGPQASVPVAAPEDAEPGRGGVQVTLSPTLTAGLGGVRDYLRNYPYTCLEQRVSPAVGLGDAEEWAAIVAELRTYQDRNGLLKFFPSVDRGSVELTGYVLSIAAAAGRELPEDLRNSLTGALALFVDGNLEEPAAPWLGNATLRRLAAIEALSRHGAARPDMLESITVEPELWPLDAVLDLWSIAARMTADPQSAARRADAERIVRSRLRTQGTTLDVGAESRGGFDFLRCADSNPLRLLALLVETGAWPEDQPLLVRGALQRQRRGHWDCTTSDAWGTVAVEHFAAAHEAGAVAGSTDVTLGTEQRRVPWQLPGDPPAAVELPWPAGKSELRVAHQGSGAPWAVVQARAAVPLRAPLEAGYRIRRSLEPVEQRRPGQFSRDDVWRVRLEIEAMTGAAWVVIDDPLPPGAAHLGTGLGRDRTVTDDEPQPWDAARPAFVERRHESFRAWYEWLPAGPLTLTYTIRLNQSGAFALPATRVEALYAPEAFAMSPNEAIEIVP
jgi:hypothetical protein